MGAIPERGGWAATLSPLRGIDAHTEGVTAFSNKPGPRRFARVPTHAIGVALEQRRYPRAKLSLPLRLVRVGEIAEAFPVTLVTRNISSSGIFFLAPRVLEVGMSVELEVALVDRPTGQGRVQMVTAAHIVRAEVSDTPGWLGYAATFDDFALQRDDVIPLRYSA
ncbi:MAG TPA: PilZ domain-containing protein [Candidatus Acidoferrales bacterium]|nr:PilZ domain-containing protein [Candidatus Acidoferrales bacterium]